MEMLYVPCNFMSYVHRMFSVVFSFRYICIIYVPVSLSFGHTN